MFWEVNSFSKSIDSKLNKEDVTLQELLDDEDILQDYKDQNKNLTQFLHTSKIIDELVTLITTEPPSDVSDSVRFKYSNIACEILTSEVPVLIERLVNSRSTLEKLYAFLEQDPPLNPLLTSFCSKTFGMLLSKKSDQDWFSYQCVCLQMLEFIKSRPGFLDTIYKHMSAPVVVDLLFQIITSIEGDELRNSLFQWLSEQQLVCNLIAMLGNEADTDKHQNIANLLCELIATGRNARQNEIQKRGYGYADSATDSSDPLIHILEDESTTDLLLDLILSNKTESAVVSGITIILKLLENPIINEPVSDTALQFLADAEKEHHKRIVANIVRQIQPRIKELHDLLVNPPPKTDITNTATLLSPPFGSTRLHICTLLSVLIETGNSDIINAICETEFFNVLLGLFKQYCWNNILHSQVKKCFTYAFSAFEHTEDNTCTPSALQTHILVKCNVASKLIDCWKHNDESQSKENGRRLGYMGHLIYMFDSLNLLVLVSHQFRALVESNLTEDELSYWKLVTDPNNGYLVSALKAQKSYLGGIDPNQSDVYDTSASKDFQDESYTGDYYNELESNMHNAVDDMPNDTATRLFEATCSMRNLNTFDTDMKYNFDALTNEFRDDIGDNTIFGSPLMPKNETDWADFDSHFSDFQITDNNSFPSLKPFTSFKHESENNGSGSSSSGAGHGHSQDNEAWEDFMYENEIHYDKDETNASSIGATDGTPTAPRKTFAEVTASSNENWSSDDKNANDITKCIPAAREYSFPQQQQLPAKSEFLDNCQNENPLRPATVVNDLSDIETTEQINAANQLNSLKANEQIDNAELQENLITGKQDDDNDNETKNDAENVNDNENEAIKSTDTTATDVIDTAIGTNTTTPTDETALNLNNGPNDDELNTNEPIDSKNEMSTGEDENSKPTDDSNATESSDTNNETSSSPPPSPPPHSESESS